MAPASDNNNQDLATKKAKLETSNNTTSTVLGGVGKLKVLWVFSVLGACVQWCYFDESNFLQKKIVDIMQMRK